MTDMRKTLGESSWHFPGRFGVQHFYLWRVRGDAGPAFMPGRLFWAYFVGVASWRRGCRNLHRNAGAASGHDAGSDVFSFCAAAAHPRIIGKSSDGNEWTTGLVLGNVRGA